MRVPETPGWWFLTRGRFLWMVQSRPDDQGWGRGPWHGSTSWDGESGPLQRGFPPPQDALAPMGGTAGARKFIFEPLRRKDNPPKTGELAMSSSGWPALPIGPKKNEPRGGAHKACQAPRSEGRKANLEGKSHVNTNDKNEPTAGPVGVGGRGNGASEAPPVACRGGVLAIFWFFYHTAQLEGIHRLLQDRLQNQTGGAGHTFGEAENILTENVICLYVYFL